MVERAGLCPSSRAAEVVVHVNEEVDVERGQFAMGQDDTEGGANEGGMRADQVLLAVKSVAELERQRKILRRRQKGEEEVETRRKRRREGRKEEKLNNLLSSSNDCFIN